MNLSRNAVQKWLIVLVVLAAILVFTLTGIGCPIYRVLGFPCPGCGMTRAVVSLLRLDFASAWQFHPMVFALPYVLILFFKDGKVFSNKILNLSVLSLFLLGLAAAYVSKLLCLQ